MEKNDNKMNSEGNFLTMKSATDFKDIRKQLWCPTTENVQMNQQSVITKDQLKALLRSATRGILLQNENRYELKSPVVEMENDITLDLPICPSYAKRIEFLSETEMQIFDEIVRTIGMEFDFSAVGSNIFLETAGVQSDNRNTTVKANTQSNYFSVAQYNFNTLGSLQVDEINLRLKPDVILQLNAIGKSIKEFGMASDLVNHKCINFLEQYGSHVSTGALHVGGVLKLCAFKKDQNSEILEHDIKSTRTALNLYLEKMTETNSPASTSRLLNEDSSNYTVKQNTRSSEIETSFTQLGGNQVHISDISQWNKALLENPNTWTIISRKDRKGIWEVISNHESEIQNCLSVAIVMKHTWSIRGNGFPQIDMDRALIETVTANFDSISQTMDKKTMVTRIQMFSSCAAWHNTFKNCVKETKKWAFFLQDAVSFAHDFDLETKIRLRILINFCSGNRIVEIEMIKRWVETPLFKCDSGILNNIITFWKGDIQRVHRSLWEESMLEHWRNQLNQQIAVEVYRIIIEHADKLNTPDECIATARCLACLDISLDNLVVKTENNFENFDNFYMLLANPTCIEVAYTPKAFSKMVILYFFKTLKIARKIYPRFETLKLESVITDELNSHCKQICEKNIEIVTCEMALLISTLSFDKPTGRIVKTLNTDMESIFKKGALLWQFMDLNTLCTYDIVCLLTEVLTQCIRQFNGNERLWLCYWTKLCESFNTALTGPDTSVQIRKTCILLQVILVKSMRMIQERKCQITNLGDLINLLEQMKTHVPRGNSEICLFTGIQDTETRFMQFTITEFLNLWELVHTRLETVFADVQSLELLNQYFRNELKGLCQNSLQLCIRVRTHDERRLLWIRLESDMNYRDLRSYLRYHNRCLRSIWLRFWDLLSFLQSEVMATIDTLFISPPYGN